MTEDTDWYGKDFQQFLYETLIYPDGTVHQRIRRIGFSDDFEPPYGYKGTVEVSPMGTNEPGTLYEGYFRRTEVLTGPILLEEKDLGIDDFDNYWA